eukprot:TRINITY_DN1724_c0_g1_i1.p1 TRINITY_DN1724_c0_g1~~TRINITY_DN1724_c0_g1_i1.p1  ORF type:complete len:265 (-),score=127.36 TRINITY_DN1724_c0_g1_i1:200-994(-)
MNKYSFDNTARNAWFEKMGVCLPKTKKTGTTIAGLVFKDGIVLGADTRATEGSVIAEKNCEKIHYISQNIYCCGAGTSADTESTTRLISSQLELHRLSTDKEPRVVTALTLLTRYLFRYQGYISAALVLGGVDFTGPHLYTISPNGYSDELPYITMGSGSLAAMAVFEAHYKVDMNLEEAKSLVHQAISSGVFNDLGSGGNIDLCIITKGNVEYLRNYDKPNERQIHKQTAYLIKRPEILAEKRVLSSLDSIVTVSEVSAMELL